MAIWGALLLILLTAGFMLTCFFLIVVVLMQEGKGGGLSGMVSGASPLSDSLGAHGAEHTLRQWTKYAAITFMVLAILLTVVGPRLLVTRGGSLREGLSTAAPTQTDEAGAGAAAEEGAASMPADEENAEE